MDAEFPNLSSLAKAHGKPSLNSYIASEAPSVKEKWTLGTALWDVVNHPDDPGSWAFHPRQQLKTLDETILHLPSARSGLWKKVKNGKDSQFLGTVVEAAWAMYFSGRKARRKGGAPQSWQKVEGKPTDELQRKTGDQGR